MNFKGSLTPLFLLITSWLFTTKIIIWTEKVSFLDLFLSFLSSFPFFLPSALPASLFSFSFLILCRTTSRHSWFVFWYVHQRVLLTQRLPCQNIRSTYRMSRTRRSFRPIQFKFIPLCFFDWWWIADHVGQLCKVYSFFIDRKKMNLSYCFELTSRVLLPPSVSSPYVNTLHNLRSLLKRNSTWTFNQYRASKVNFWKVNCSPRPRLIHYWFDFGHQLFGRRLNVQVFFFFLSFSACSSLLSSTAWKWESKQRFSSKPCGEITTSTRKQKGLWKELR